MPLFTSQTGFRARQRKAGLASARYWKEQGFANLGKAREARSRYAALKREWLAENADRRHVLEWNEDSWKCDCGLSADSPDKVVPMHRKASQIEAGFYARRSALPDNCRLT